MTYRDGLIALRQRQGQGVPLDREEVARRFAELRGSSFADGDVLAAFADVFDAVCAPDHIRFIPRRECCSIDFEAQRLSFQGDLKSVAGDAIGTIQRRLHFAERLAWHGQIIIDPRFRSVGIAPIILSHSLGFYERVGIENVQLTAALTTGPYYWAKLGFDFATPEDSRDVQHWFARVNAKLNLGLDCRGERPPREWASLGKEPRVTCSLEAIAAAFPDRRETIEVRARDNDLSLDADLPAGKAILLSIPRWHGRLPVSRRSRAFVQAYVGARGALAAARLQGSVEEAGNTVAKP